MLSKISASQIYLGNYGWHAGRFHFSFAEYCDPENDSFGDLITFNDFTIQPGSGFAEHPHEEIEIVSYCVNGELVHEDNLGNKEILRRGEMQYTCAGSGITHCEGNASALESLRFVQIWIRPNAPGLQPSYRFRHFKQSERQNRLLQIVSGQSIKDGIRIHQDMNIFVSEINTGRQLEIQSLPDRQVYLVCLEGAFDINTIHLEAGDALKIQDEMALTLTAVSDSHLIMVEMSGIN
jgi:redox-sensitive bicupin YhaK (pirin superfamily)